MDIKFWTFCSKSYYYTMKIIPYETNYSILEAPHYQTIVIIWSIIKYGIV